MNLNPFSIVILLDLNGELLEEWEVSQFADPALECLLAIIVEESVDNGTRYLVNFVPEYEHHHQHNQVEQSQLQDNEEAVKESGQEDKSNGNQEYQHADRVALNLWMVLRV